MKCEASNQLAKPAASDTGVEKSTAGTSPSSSELILPRYISLPDQLYTLRHSYPSVMEAVLLECTRCHQWTTVEVLKEIPDETPTAPACSAEAAERVRTQLGNTYQQKMIQKAASRREPPVWHSARLRHLVEEHNTSSEADVAPETVLLASLLRADQRTKKAFSSIPPQRYIPNPANFVCSAPWCAKGEAMLELQQRWLRELYRVMDTGSANNTTPTDIASSKAATSASRATEEHAVRQDALNEALAQELHVRRSDRLAGRRQSSGGPARESHTSPNSAEVNNRLQAAWVQSAAQQLLREDDSVLSAFCWVICARCGKLRRVACPFPGGAPFLCALASTAGSCDVSEADGVANFAVTMTERELRQAALASPFLSYPLKQQYDQLTAAASRAEPDQSAGASPAFPSSAQVPALVDEPLLKIVRGETARRAQRAVAHQQSNGLLQPEAFPTLKQLASVIRKRSLGTFAKYLMQSPAELRQKREDVLRQCFVHDATPAVRIAGASEDTIIKTDDITEPVKAETRKRQKETRVSSPSSSPPSKQRATAGSRDDGSAESVNADKKDVDGAETAEEFSETPPKRVCGRPSKPSHEKVTPAAPPVPGRGRGRPKGSGKHQRQQQALASATASEAPAAEGRGDGRSGARRAKARHVEEDADASTDDVIHWVQCDACGKWRIVPERITDSITFWACRMRGDGTTCADMDDEKRMQLGKQ